MAKTSKQDEVKPTIVIKKVKKVAGGHHGGAWKVAYADFVTAMMAFFLLLWLLNVVTNEALETVSNYFDPSNPKIAESVSGAGGLMGGTAVSTEGAMTSTVQPLTKAAPTGLAQDKKEEERKPESQADLKRLETELKKQEEENFRQAKAELEKEMAENPELKDLAKNLMVDITPEGLRIQLVDQDGKPMFPSGSAEMFDYTTKLLGLVAKVVLKMPNDISLRGHTDSQQYAPGNRYTNWELSSDRANASRRALLGFNVPEKRLANVMGKADREPLNADNPADPRNRRLSIILLRETVRQAAERGAFGPAFKPSSPAQPAAPAKPPAAYQKTPGAVYFP